MKGLFGSLAGLVTVCYSCTPPAATPDELVAALSSVPYDQRVIGDLPRYESLALFLLTHVDTLIATRNATRTVTFVNGTSDSQRDTTYVVPEDCHTFFEGNDRFDLKTAPPFLQQGLVSLFHQFAHGQIQSFEVCEEGRVVLGVRSEKVTGTLWAEHELIWDPFGRGDRPNTLTYILDKDTVLPPGCIYRIGLVEDRGW
jgi:hypothetical protein